MIANKAAQIFPLFSEEVPSATGKFPCYIQVLGGQPHTYSVKSNAISTPNERSLSEGQTKGGVAQA